MEDIAPELYNRIQHKMKSMLTRDMDIVKKIRKGKASQKMIAEYANKVGTAASVAFKQVLKLEDLPDGKLYWNIAEKTIGQTMQDIYGDVNQAAAIQLRADDIKKGFKFGIKNGFAPDRRINKILEDAVNQTTQEGLDEALGEPVTTTARRYYDDFQKVNAEARSKLGFDIRVKRKYDDVGLHRGTRYARPCQWCIEREGEYSMEEAKALGIFNRHNGCGCTIEYITPNKTQVQTDWTRNEWAEI